MSEVTGFLINKGPIKEFGSNGFKVVDFVVKTNEQYPQTILLQFQQDKVNILDKYNIGDEVKVSINIRGREWVNPQGETQYFNTLVAWRIEKQNASGYTGQGSAADDYQARKQEEEQDDLPF